jgi:hypothetical protein
VLALCFGCTEPTAPRPIQGISAPSLNATPAKTEVVYGPEQFTRTAGQPNTYTRRIDAHLYEAPFTLHLVNGAADGSSRVSSAVVSIDGTPIITQHDLNQHVSAISRAIQFGGTTATLSVQVAGAPGGFVSISVAGRRRALRVCPGDPASYQSLADAVEAADDGATILLCDGTHHVPQIELGDKSLTITAEGPGMPTLDGDGAANVFRVTPEAPVKDTLTIRRLRFVNAIYDDILIGKNIGTVIVDSSEFHPNTEGTPRGTLGYRGGIQADSVRTGTIIIRDNHFIGGDVGVLLNVTDGFDIEGNLFEAPENAGVHAGNSGGASPPYDTYASSGRVAHNTVTHCGWSWCMGFFSVGTVVIDSNTVSADASETTGQAIYVQALSATIRGNTVSVDGGQSRSFQFGGIDVRRTVSAVVSGNRISGADRGVSVDSSVATITDNTISNVRTGIGAWFQSSVHANRNDISGYDVPMELSNDLIVADARCNWWGSASGPSTMPDWVPAEQYVPFATQPIANTSVACDPNAGLPKLVRACATSTPGGPLTAPTVSLAYAWVAVGGTVDICAGTYDTQSLNVTKAVTIEGEGTAVPTLTTGAYPDGRGDQVLNLYQTTGPITLRRLHFTGGLYRNVSIGQTGAPIAIWNSVFDGVHAPNGFGAGVYIAPTTTGIDIESSTFTGGDQGVGASGGLSPDPIRDLVVRNSTFTHQTQAAIAWFDNTSGRLEGNTFSDCGTMQCVEYGGYGHVDVIGNTVLADASRAVDAGINLYLDSSLGVGDATIANNVVTGSGSTGSDRRAQSYYPIHTAGIRAQGGHAVFTGNRVSGAYGGIVAGGGSLQGTDNVVSHVFAPFLAGGPFASDQMSFQRNDFTDYVMALGWDGGIGTGDFRCNWWGSAAGPHDWPTWNAIPVYAPVATAPIAGTGDVCAP